MVNYPNIEHKKNPDGSRTGYARTSTVYRIKGCSGHWFAYQKNGMGCFAARTLLEISEKLGSR
jgi:hypothetical protein